MNKLNNYYKSGKILGLTSKDINSIFKSNNIRYNNISLETGPYPCGGGFYGMISINDF